MPLCNSQNLPIRADIKKLNRLSLPLFLFSFFYLVVLSEGTFLKSPSAMTNKKIANDEILLVFSDLDGTLIHYPENIPDDPSEILKLPPSSTGMRGVISGRTLSLTQEIRKKGVKMILISGMRASTLFSRLPYLPRADAYAVEAGGRIFYPANENSRDNLITVKPQKYKGVKEEELTSFGLVEDLVWRKNIEEYCGSFDSNQSRATDRDGLLWEYGRRLIEKGFVLDTKGYSSCFRVNKKQQVSVSDDDFNALKDGRMELFSGLATSVNLNCIDIYPAISGKKNCCQYLAEKFFPEEEKKTLLSSKALCLCDDDNDIDMAMACLHAYIPTISSKSMADLIHQNQEHFTLTGGEEGGEETTKASELALDLIIGRLADGQSPSKSP